MGLFSFLKNVGSKVFAGKKAEAPKADPGISTEEALRNHQAALLKSVVNGLGIEVKDLKITVYEDTVTLEGEAPTQADKEKVILAVGNVEGIATVDDRMTVSVEEKAAVFYEVKKGDSLSKIAKAHYGNAMKYPVIFEANKPMLKDPDLIYPGQVLRIPDIQA